MDALRDGRTRERTCQESLCDGKPDDAGSEGRLHCPEHGCDGAAEDKRELPEPERVLRA